MKRLVGLLLVLMLLVGTLASCDVINGLLGTNGNGNEEIEGGEDFDINRVSFTSAYSEAQKLGFEGTLDEFIAMIGDIRQTEPPQEITTQSTVTDKQPAKENSVPQPIQGSLF
jgi:hypothetical protein